MKNLIILSTILMLLATQQIFAQYSKVSFKTKEPLQLWVDGKAVHEGYAKYFKLRLNQGRQYELKFYVKNEEGIVVNQSILVGAEERKADYMVKYHKRKKQYRLILKSAKDKVSVADGLRKMGNMSYSAESSSASADENGNVSVEHSKESGSVDGAAIGDSVDAVTSIFKNDKKKKKAAEDPRTVVVLKIK